MRSRILNRTAKHRSALMWFALGACVPALMASLFAPSGVGGQGQPDGPVTDDAAGAAHGDRSAANSPTASAAPVEVATRHTAIVDVVERCRRAVVSIEVGKSDSQRTGTGSGVLINARGYLISNYHVVRDAQSIRVAFEDGEQYDATLEAVSDASDLALLKLADGRRQQLPYVRLGTSSDLMIGETVLAIGSPYGFGHTVSQGVVSANARSLRLPGAAAYSDFIQTDAAINPGNSGGALINVHGELVGVNSAIFNQGWGIAFAIPIDRIKDLLSSYVRKEHSLGLQVREQDRALAVTAVVPGSAADHAGLRLGDTLLFGNGQRLEKQVDLVVSSLGASPTSPLRLHVRRGDSELAIEVRGVSLLWSMLGVFASDAEQRGDDGRRIQGVQIQLVREDSPARLGLLVGDFVVGIRVPTGSDEPRNYRVHNEDDLLILLERYPNQKLTIEFLRHGRHVELHADLGE